MLKDELYSKFSDAVLRAARMYCTGVMSQIEKLWGQGDNSNLAGSIHKMMKPVEQSTNKGFIVLIDEYDHPQQHALEENYINDAEKIMKTFYIELLKVDVL
ncbi:hypothetical protein C0993_006016 [Termitomyces sp. T159_Od127]|nr:hypothetical protein C0993_006016 [Termitomyces sp. T159_Od127]